MPYNYYAVLVGREGAQIYDNSAKFFRATYGLSGASGRGFDTIEEAQQWLNMHFRRMAAMQMRTDTNINVTVNITNNIMQPPGAGAQTSSTAATAMTTSVTHGSSTFPRQPVHHTHMGSHMPPQHVQQPPSQVPPPVPPEREVTLSEEQENILDLVRRRKNVFFTGAAGTGKSVLLREIIKVLTNMYSPKEVAITAPTGVAGLNIGGRTIHSWAGVGYGKESVQRLYDGLSNFKKMRWRSTKALIHVFRTLRSLERNYVQRKIARDCR